MNKTIENINYYIQHYFLEHYVMKFVSDLRQVSGFIWISTPVSSTNKTDRLDIAEILLKLALTTTTLTLTLFSGNK
jgi:hypothetical protein